MDYSKTIDFFVEAHRLCASRRDCKLSIDDRCPLYELCEKAVPKLSRKDIEYAIEALHEWSRENPRKTYARDFFEKFPEAQRNGDGVPFVCRKRIYGGIHSTTLEDCDNTGACYRCWNELMNDKE